MNETPKRDIVGALNEIFASIAGWCFDHRIVVVLVTLVALAGSVVLAGMARIDNSFEAYFDEGDETFGAYTQYREDFGSDEISYILYHAPSYEHGPWNLEVMQKIDALTRILEEEIPFVYEARSLVNSELIQGTENGIEIQEIQDAFPKTQEELLALRSAYLAKPMLVGGILSADANYGAIIVKMDRSSTDPPDEIRFDPDGGDGLQNVYPQVTYTALEEALTREEFAGIEFYHSGDVPLNSIYNTVIGEESIWLNVLTAAVIGLLLLLVFRSFIGALGPLIVVQSSALFCVAFIGVLGWKLDLSFSAMPTLLTAIGVAHSVHILSEFRTLFAKLGDRRAALVKTIYLVGTPCLITSLTTAAGFGALSVVPIKSIAHYGVYGAAGVIFAFILSLTLLMAMLSLGRSTPKRGAVSQRTENGRARTKAALTAIANFNLRNSTAILVGFALVFIVSAVGISRIVVDSNWLNDFSDSMPIKVSTLQVDSVMGGAANLIYLFDTGEDDGIKNPAVLREIDRVASIAQSQGELVRKTYSLVDILKDLNQAFHGGDPAWYRVPETRELVAQYLILYETSGGEAAEEYVSSDYRRASLELRLKLDATSKTEALVSHIDTELEKQPVRGASLELTGIGALWLKLMDHIVTSQIRGFLLAFAVVGVMMILVFRSIKIGAITMLPNLLPIALTVGAMGWFDIPLDYSKLSIAAVALGIAVDGTIHLVLRCRHEFLLHRNYEIALRNAMQNVGRALLITSAALVLGFLMFLFSVLTSQATFGILLAITIVTALIADFLLMPSLILAFKPFGPEGHHDKASDSQRIQEAA